MWRRVAVFARSTGWLPHHCLPRRCASSKAADGFVYFEAWGGGAPTKAVAVAGQTMLDVARANRVPLEGACEASLSCSTCHVIVDSDTFSALPPPGDDELDMLDVAFGRTNTSRLGCCIVMSDVTRGMRLRLPPSTDAEIAAAETTTYAQHGPVRSTQVRLGQIQDKFNPASTKMSKGPFTRLHGIQVKLSQDPGETHIGPHPGLLKAVAAKLGSVGLSETALTVVRKSLDARRRHKRPVFTYVVDVDLAGIKVSNSVPPSPPPSPPSAPRQPASIASRDPVIVVGAGPAGLFAALRLAEAGVKVTLLERGQAVDRRGADIGTMYVRGVLDPESNMCFGMGGAGTWSDGKLTTRIGQNSEEVRAVLHTLVELGATARILKQGKPHLGTDRMISMLRNMRVALEAHGVKIVYGARVENVRVCRGRVTGVDTTTLASNTVELLSAAAVVLAVGHSARELYERLHASGQVKLEFQPFALGFRAEHPQELINRLQYGSEAALCGWNNKLPVADYSLVARTNTKGLGGTEPTAAYSFCMCPGGQVVPTSLTPDELCVNGMSFSKRSSSFANSGVVVPVGLADCLPFVDRKEDEVLAGLAFQRHVERDAARRGGGALVAPVQSIVDFMEGRPHASASLPPSSYRLGVRHSELHTLYPPQVTEALRQGLAQFDKELAGYVSTKGLLHGVESRTSSPVRIVRDRNTLQSPSAKGLYPVGEGAGYAGGIVSAAVDGARAAFVLLDELVLTAEQSRHKSVNAI